MDNPYSGAREARMDVGWDATPFLVKKRGGRSVDLPPLINPKWKQFQIELISRLPVLPTGILAYFFALLAAFLADAFFAATFTAAFFAGAAFVTGAFLATVFFTAFLAVFFALLATFFTAFLATFFAGAFFAGALVAAFLATFFAGVVLTGAFLATFVTAFLADLTATLFAVFFAAMVVCRWSSRSMLVFSSGVNVPAERIARSASLRRPPKALVRNS